MKYESHGTVLPSLDVWLEAGESVYTKSGAAPHHSGRSATW